MKQGQLVTLLFDQRVAGKWFEPFGTSHLVPAGTVVRILSLHATMYGGLVVEYKGLRWAIARQNVAESSI